MTDERCCGTGTCIIDQDGFCWCGQKWDGEKMCQPPLVTKDAEEDAGLSQGAPHLSSD